jgi:hypothetical protein
MGEEAMTVREATLSDIPGLLSMATEFQQKVQPETPVKEAIIKRDLQRMIRSRDAVVFTDDQHRCGLCGQLGRRLFSDRMVAEETAWWIREGAQSLELAREVLSAFVGWAQESGAEDAMLSDMTPEQRLGILYRRFGFLHKQQTYHRRFQ